MGLNDIALREKPTSELRDITCHMRSTDTGERVPPNPISQKSWHSIYLPRRDGRLSWPR